MSLESYESTKLIWEVVITRLLNEEFMTLWKIVSIVITLPYN
jgi:hypothetical protein